MTIEKYPSIDATIEVIIPPTHNASVADQKLSIK